MTKPDAVIFDMDGTLTDTETLWEEVRIELAAQHGIFWTSSATQATMGMSTAEWSRYMAESVKIPGTPDELAEQVISGLEARYQQALPVIPGAIETVKNIAAHCPTAIASSSPLGLVRSVAGAMGLDETLKTCVSTEEVERGKPFPDGFLEAANRIGARPERCVVIEDSTNGVLSGLAAGMKVIAVPPKFHPPAPELLARCHLVLATISEVTPEMVDGLFN